jgi:signal transduction histidine kinase
MEDVALAGAFLVVAALEIGFSSEPSEVSRPLLGAMALVTTAALVWRRRAPFASALVVFGTLTLVAVFWQTSGLWMALVAVVAVYSVAAHTERLPALIAAGLWCVGGALPIAQEDNRDIWDFVGNYLFFALLLTAAPWIAGRVVRRRQARAAQLQERVVAVERESDERARAAVGEERLRIARELHDVVGHALGVIVVQAGAERATLSRAPDSTHDTLLTIERTGRAALGEMRRLLDLMRGAGDDIALAPQPTLEQLPRLIDELRAAGLPVEVRIEGRPRPLAPGVDLAVYRIVQEALTNTLKHSGRARARVTIRYAAAGLELEITDDGAASAGPADGDGHGLIGMRERVALHHGSLATGALPGGGFAVTARLPYGS